MRTVFMLIILAISFASCTQDQFDPQTESSLQWFCGEGKERVEEEVAVLSGSTIKLIIKQNDFCAGANAIKLEIRLGDQLLLQEETLSFPREIQIPITAAGRLQIASEVVPGPALILCSRLGRAQIFLNYSPE